MIMLCTLRIFGSIISNLDDSLEQVVKPASCVDLVDCKVNHVKVVVVEDYLFVCCLQFKVVVTLLEEPSCLFDKPKFSNILQMNHVVGCMGELIGAFVRD